MGSMNEPYLEKPGRPHMRFEARVAGSNPAIEAKQ